MARGTKKYMVALSDETAIPVVTTTAVKAVNRIRKWLEKTGSTATVIAVNEVR